MNIDQCARPTHASDRGTAYVLGLGISAAWVIVLAAPSGMGARPASFIAAWTVMMAAMMLPSAAPLVLLYRRGAAPVATATLVAGCILVWAAVGVPAYVAHEFLPMGAAPIALAAAGLYQLTPFKQSCLRRCRGPADFLMQRWGRGAMRLGLEHGAWCVGCCWALMLVLVLAGAMGLAWVVGIAAVVAVEKLTRHGALWSLHGRLGGPWGIFINTYALTGPMPRRFTVQLADYDTKVTIGEDVALELKKIRNPVSGAEAHPEVILPEGLVLKRGRLAASQVFRVRNSIAYDHSGQYAAFGRFEYAGS